jgi:hypothetical protein
MKSAQARRLIGDLMAWDNTRATQEFQWLDLMVIYKFDHYHGYGPGHRFYLSLLRWLGQFEMAERETAYHLLRDHLIYIRQAEMHHLVGLSGALFRRRMRQSVAVELGLPVYEVDESAAAQRRLKLLQARTLYVGVSDGARIDVFRRFNEGVINNEQVVAMAEISEGKWNSLHKKLDERLKSYGLAGEAVQFEWVCLIDDFTGSAYSAIRQEPDGSWDGKVGKFVKEHEARASNKLINPARILVHHYIASAAARDNVVERCAEIGKTFPHLTFIPEFSHVLQSDIVISSARTPELAALLMQHYDKGVEDTIKGTDLQLGFKGGGLPLVLEHNTPNNSVGLLWASSEAGKPIEGKQMSALFPRRQRHFEVK